MHSILLNSVQHLRRRPEEIDLFYSLTRNHHLRIKIWTFENKRLTIGDQ